MTARRFLRPTDLVPVGDMVWAFDEFHPVAVVFDATSGGVRRRVSWRRIDPYLTRSVAGDEHGVWLQPSPTGPLIRLGSDGVEFTTATDDVEPLGTEERIGRGGAAGLARRRSAGGWTFRTVLATRAGAWSVPVNPPESDNAGRPEDPPRAEPGTSVLRFTTRGGATRSVRCPGRVVQVAACDGAAFLHVDIAADGRRQVPVYGHGGVPLTGAELPAGTARWALTCRNGWLRLPDDGHTIGCISSAAHAAASPPRTHGYRSVHYSKMAQWYQEGQLDRRNRAGELDWIWGWDESQDAGIWGRRVVATGHDPTSRLCRRSVELGAGWVEAGVGIGRYLWLTIRRRIAPGLCYPTEVLRIDGATGDVTTVLGLDSLCIDGAGWPLIPRPADADEHARREEARVLDTVVPGNERSGLGDSPDGPSQLRVGLVGSWPDTVVRLRFRDPRWPGLMMQRDTPVFDELGRCEPVDLEWVGWRLQYWLEAGLAPTPGQAVGGVLEL